MILAGLPGSELCTWQPYRYIMVCLHLVVHPAYGFALSIHVIYLSLLTAAGIWPCLLLFKCHMLLLQVQCDVTAHMPWIVCGQHGTQSCQQSQLCDAPPIATDVYSSHAAKYFHQLGLLRLCRIQNKYSGSNANWYQCLARVISIHRWMDLWCLYLSKYHRNHW